MSSDVDAAPDRRPPSPHLEEASRRIDLPTITAAQIDLAAREVPAVGALPDEVLRGPFADAFGRATEAVFVALLEDRRLSERELQGTADAFAEVMTIWGLVIDDVIATFAQGARLLWEAVERHAAPAQLRAFLRAGGGALDSAALIERIAIEAARRPPESSERAARRALTTVADEPPAPAATAARAFVAVRPDAGQRDQAALAGELRAAGAIAVTSDGHVVGSLPFGAEPPRIDGDLLVVEAVPRHGDTDARRRRLRTVMSLALRRGRRGLLTDLEMSAERMLAAAPDVVWRLHQAIAAVRDAPSSALLLPTAEAFVAADGDVAATAKHLGLHRESARHRIRRIEEATGLNLSGWRGRCLLSLALRAASDDVDDPLRCAIDRATGSGADDESASAGAPPIAAILERLDRHGLEQRLVAYRRAHHPDLSSVLAAVDAEVPNARADLEEIVALLGDQRVPREEVLARVGRRTFAYLRLGAAVEDVVAAGRSTPRIVWNALLDATTDDELPHLRTALTQLVVYIEGTQVAVGQPAGVNRGATFEDLVEALIDAEATPQRRIALAAACGVTLETPLRPFVVALGRASTMPAGRVRMDLSAAGWPAVEHGGHLLGIAPPDAVDQRLAGLVPSDAVVVLGAPTPAGDLGPVVARLRQLVDVALSQGRTGRIDLLDAAIELLLISEPDVAEAFREEIVAPLEHRDVNRGGDLVQTLHAYVAHDLQRGATATVMHLHPNSIDYRLQLVRQETGRTPTSIDDVLAILYGVTADQLRTARAGSRGEP